MPLFVGASESYDTDAWEAYNLKNENTNLRERITTQKQTIQAYRDESREWREVAERAQAENAKLRELARGLVYATHPADRARLIADAVEFGIEVDG